MKNKKLIIISLIFISLLALSLLVSILFKKTYKTQTSSCNHDNTVCEAISEWDKYKNSNDFSSTFEILDPNEPKTTKHVYISDGYRRVRIIYYKNNKLISDTIFTDQQEYNMDINSGTYKGKKLTTRNFFEGTPKNDDSSTSLFIDKVFQNQNIFKFKFVTDEKCEPNNCNKYQILPNATDEVYKKTLNLQDYQINNLKNNTYYIWINTETYQIFRGEEIWKTGQQFILTYDFSDQTISLPN